ncbi:hypothetical protein V3481_003970 [Fusarium oxysporum f. sp. vasinfectum]|jgi:hypothetical protein|uniref:Uncharacterized protein n=1 Tax=Fusarium oxysporum TaxID=5507 RepID=A0A420NL93_FUSOX|nr:hypothetical protein BFJ69_g3970 [Fusarium oxysporum]
MNVGQGDASNLKAFVRHSNETSHGNRATARAAKDRELANDTIPAPYVLNMQSEGRKSQQSYEISGTADEAKGARGHHEQVLDPQKDAYQARCMTDATPPPHSRTDNSPHITMNLLVRKGQSSAINEI